MKIKEFDHEGFTPFSFSIHIESEEELIQLYHRLNVSDHTITEFYESYEKGKKKPKDICSAHIMCLFNYLSDQAERMKISVYKEIDE